MIENLPGHVGPVFMITTFVCVIWFLHIIRSNAADALSGKLLLFLIPAWLIFQTIIAIGGTYLNTSAFPPRLFLFGAGPALILVIGYLFFARGSLIAKMPLGALTVIHVIRIPVEIVLSWLHDVGSVPAIMTYHGQNFDIISGLTAPIVYLIAFRKGRVNVPVLLVWNLAGLALLLNIVITAVLSAPTPLQMLAFDQPNRAVLYFPFIWLPTIVVPIVLFCHFASLYKLLVTRRSESDI